MDPVFEAATKRIDELKQELKKLEEFVGTYRKLALELRIDTLNIQGTASPSTEDSKPVDHEQPELAREAEEPDAPAPKRVRVSDNPPPAVVVEAAIELIRATGRPMSRKEIREGLVARGVVVNGADPVKTMGTILWRAPDRIVQVEGRGYWPKTDAPPPGNMVDVFGGELRRAE